MSDFLIQKKEKKKKMYLFSQSKVRPNINDDTREEFDERIQKAACALADLLYQIDFKTSHASDEKGGNVKSMSSGGRSISFGSNETLIDKVLGDKVAQSRLCYDTVCEYLSGTGLLYAGV